ncbi:hypothetical protein T439DRAFT_328769 [Meredithblackwellia eburnea MCA 4105]
MSALGEEDDTSSGTVGAQQPSNTLANPVISIEYADLVDLLGRSTVTSPQESVDSADSVEIMSPGGKRRRKSSTPLEIIDYSASSKRMKMNDALRSGTDSGVEGEKEGISPGLQEQQDAFAAHDQSGTGKLAVFDLSLTFTESSIDVKPLKAHILRKTLDKHPEICHPAILTPVSFSHTRLWTKSKVKATTQHEIVVTLPEKGTHRNVPLLNLGALDRSNALARAWAARGKSAGSGASIPAVGEGGLLDALVYLQSRGSVEIEGQLSVEVSKEDDKETTFHLRILGYLLPPFFSDSLTSSYSSAKHLLIRHLFYLSPSSFEGWNGETSVDFFYHCLGRAPKTKDGIPLVPGPGDFSLATRGKQREKKVESDEEKEARRRRKEKGKGKARDQDFPGDNEESDDEEGGDGSNLSTPGEDDVLLRPPGLKATLMPFQSRSVRWMLAREGKIVVAIPNEGPRMDVDHEVPPHDDAEMEEAVQLEDDDDAGGEASVVLEDAPEEVQLALKRGPLWERMALKLVAPVPGHDEGVQMDGTADERSVEVWLNRVTSMVSLVDPALSVENMVLKKLDDDEEDADEDGGSAKVVDRKRVSGQGLLSEEMGLGKTIEVISLILLHRAPERNLLPSYFDPQLDSIVQPSGVTLIIAPAAIIAQWYSEIQKHAPTLRVLRYESIKSIKDTMTARVIASQFDVIITTFDVLRREVVFARKPHERALRSGRENRHQYRRSLLVQLEFLRVIMDEAQMVGDTVSLTSETASLIPRCFSFAVTGTPLKSRIEDLNGLLRFLKVEPIASNRNYLPRLLDEVPSFVHLWKQIGARTLKSHVEHELLIPAQHRFVVPIDFTAVEKYWYDARYLEALEQLGLESDGTPKDSSLDENGIPIWQLDKGEMNRWLVALRQLCCHPQVGQGNKRVLGSVLKTVDDVLSTMFENARSGVHSDQRALWVARVKRAQLMTYDREDCERFENALQVFNNAYSELQPIVDEVVGSLKDAWKDRKAERVRRGRSSSASDDELDDNVGDMLGLGLDDDDKNDIPASEKERSIASRISALRNRLREILLVQHSALFFAGATYFNMGKFAEEERKAYADAENLRQSILKPYESRVEVAAVRLRAQMDAREKDNPLDILQLEVSFSEHGHGLVASEVFKTIEETADLLNGYAELIWSWRETILNIIYTRVSISGDDATGEEYAERAEQQEKLDCYLEAYGALLADWRHGLTGERSALDENLDLEAYGYNNKKNVWAAADGSRRARVKKDEQKKARHNLKDRIAPSIEAGDSPADVLRYELLVERSEVKSKWREDIWGKDNEGIGEHSSDDEEDHYEDDSRGKKSKNSKRKGKDDVEVTPLRNSIKALKDAGELIHRYEEEEILELESKRVKAILGAKEKVLDRLRGEYSEISKAFNARLNYFTQLQTISDEVVDPDFISNKWRGFPVEMGDLLEEETKLIASIAKKSSQRRYLESLQSEGAKTDDEVACLICATDYVNGILTSCGHIFCQDCFRAWHARSRSCAVCKRELRQGDWESVRYRRPPPPQEPEDSGEARVEYENLEDVAFDTQVPLRTIATDELAEIEMVETVAPLSSKSDMIVKHVKLIRRTDPTAKIVIFSAWIEALSILMQAFTRNGVQYVRLEGGGKKESVVTKFINDPTVAAFFLHTKSQAAGLNLICAQYVFLVEPLLHPSLELQAVGRIHRIGQSKETRVFQYFVRDSVDERLAELRGRHKSSLFLNSGPVNTRKESLILQDDMAKTNTADKKGSEESIDDEDDISRILFAPDHFVNIQRSLLPVRLRGRRREDPTPSQMAAKAALARSASGTGEMLVED